MTAQIHRLPTSNLRMALTMERILASLDVLIDTLQDPAIRQRMIDRRVKVAAKVALYKRRAEWVCPSPSQPAIKGEGE